MPGGLGHLLAQRLLAAGERVLDVPPKLGARVRLLAAGDVNKNDPNDARSVAIAALSRATGKSGLMITQARRRPYSATKKATGQGSPVKTQHPKGTSHAAKRTDPTA